MNSRLELATVRESGHPWIFRRMLKKGQRFPPNGASVDIFNRNGEFVGVGLYSANSHISIRIVSNRQGEEIGKGFLVERFLSARTLREDVLGIPQVSDAYRLLNSEGDGLSGLIVDKFGTTFVVDIRSTGWWKRRDTIREAIGELYGEAEVYFTSTPNVEEKERLSIPPLPSKKIFFYEHGIHYVGDLSVAHKTGFFLDQRDNRAMITRLVQGRKVLDCCCYTGGFSLNAAKAGAKEVVGIDLDEAAIEAARKNCARNELKCRFVHVDAFPYLRDLIRNGDLPDFIFLDPPKIIHTREDYPQGEKTYFDLNYTALSALPRGGFLFTFSCSGRLSEEAFLSIIMSAAYRAGKNFQVLCITGAAPDHPYLLNAPETRYLKGVLGRVI
jgi:23S rRNA (cytosine1962-C5)-methyltransferase